MKVLSKHKLAKSNKRYFKFIFTKRPVGKSYWLNIEENTITYNNNNSFYEGIFFSEEQDVIKWLGFGDTLVEIVFDENHPEYRKLPDYYVYEAKKYCGSAIITGSFIPMDSPEMFEFIMGHIKENEIDEVIRK